MTLLLNFSLFHKCFVFAVLLLMLKALFNAILVVIRLLVTLLFTTNKILITYCISELRCNTITNTVINVDSIFKPRNK